MYTLLLKFFPSFPWPGPFPTLSHSRPAYAAPMLIMGNGGGTMNLCHPHVAIYPIGRGPPNGRADFPSSVWSFDRSHDPSE